MGGITWEAATLPRAVSEQRSSLAFDRVFFEAPYFLSSLASYHGNDNSHLRYRNLDALGVELHIGEDTTYDSETNHTLESVSYLAIGGAGLLAAPVAQDEIGETGQLTDLTHTERTILLQRSYSDPVVFAQSPTAHGGDPAVVRVSNVQTDRFSIRLAEPSNENGFHNARETVSYLVLEAGQHQLPDGRILEAGKVNTSATVGASVPSQWRTVNLSTSFAATPVVLTQIQTQSGADYLQTRQQLIHSGRFQVALQQEESVSSSHVAETIGYLALESGVGASGSLSVEAGYTPTTITNALTTHNFDSVFNAAPHFLSSLASYGGPDSAHIRYSNLTASGVQLKIGEDTTLDAETNHGQESVAYLAISGAGILSAIPTSTQNALRPPQVAAHLEESNSSTIINAGERSVASRQTINDVLSRRAPGRDEVLERFFSENGNVARGSFYKIDVDLLLGEALATSNIRGRRWTWAHRWT